MPRTWSNAKHPPSISPAQRAKAIGPNSLSTYTILLIVCALWFLGLVAYTMFDVTVHPITQLPQATQQQPKDE